MAAINLKGLKDILRFLNPFKFREQEEPKIKNTTEPEDKPGRTLERYRVERKRKNRAAALSRRRNW